MSGIMRPVGPEPSETYWMRRALVAGAFLVLLIIILLFLFNLGGRPGQAAPAGTPSVAPTGNATSGTSAEASATPSSSPSDSPSASTAPSTRQSSTASSKPSSKPSADPTTNGKPSPGNESDEKSSKPDDADTTKNPDEAKKPDQKKQDDEKKQDQKKQDEQQADSPKKDEPAKPRYADCDPKKLRATIRSDKHNVGVRDKVDFELSVINGGETPCTLDLTDKNYELKIFSGSDRIWSSNDCAKIEPELHKIMQPEQQVEWSITWNGKRSDEDATCKARPEIPRPGYYYATSAIKGAKPVQFLLVLR